MTKFQKYILYYGSDEFAITEREMRAGPVSLVLQGPDLRLLRVGGIELIQRIYGAVRDRNWDTIPATYSDWKINISRNEFAIGFLAEHKRGDIDFAWRGSISGSIDGLVRYSMDGISRSTFHKCLIGLCVHFPVSEYHGRQVRVLKRGGRTNEATFPFFISPIQPLPGFEDMEGIDYEPGGSVSMQLRFLGDAFEMEDQRNWTDGSYKAYSFPGAEPLPIEIRKGEKVAQTVTVHFDFKKQKIRAGGTRRVKQMTTSTISVEEEGTERRVPKLGLGCASHRQPIPNHQLKLLKDMNLAHLRVDLHLYDERWRTDLSLASSQAKEIGVPIETVLFHSENAEQELKFLRRELDSLKPNVAVFLLFQKGETATPEKSVELTRAMLADYKEESRIGGGTDRNFFDLSLRLGALKDLDIISYSINPQVHATDITSLIETFEGETWTVLSAREVIKDRRLAISPITIRPRFNPDLTGPEPLPEPGELPYQVDPRQMSLFGACWTAGSIKALAEAGVDSLTYYETTGWRGVMETERGSLMQGEFPSQPGMVFPLYHVIADVAEMSGGTIHRSTSTNPMVNALTMSRNGHVRTLIFNLAPHPQQVLLKGPASGNSRIRRLNENTAIDAMFNPEEFRKKGNIRRSTRNRERTFILLPYEVLRIDTPSSSY
jgi:hypothetical protein